LDSEPGQELHFFINADGLGDSAHLKIELLDAREHPIPAYSGKNAAIVSTNGFQVPLLWNGEVKTKGLPSRFRIHVVWENTQIMNPQFHALYIRR